MFWLLGRASEVEDALTFRRHFKRAISTGTNPPVSPPYCSYSPRIGMQDVAQIRAHDVIERLTALESLRSCFE